MKYCFFLPTLILLFFLLPGKTSGQAARWLQERETPDAKIKFKAPAFSQGQNGIDISFSAPAYDLGLRTGCDTSGLLLLLTSWGDRYVHEVKLRADGEKYSGSAFIPYAGLGFAENDYACWVGLVAGKPANPFDDPAVRGVVFDFVSTEIQRLESMQITVDARINPVNIFGKSWCKDSGVPAVEWLICRGDETKPIWKSGSAFNQLNFAEQSARFVHVEKEPLLLILRDRNKAGDKTSDLIGRYWLTLPGKDDTLAIDTASFGQVNSAIIRVTVKPPVKPGFTIVRDSSCCIRGSQCRVFRVTCTLPENKEAVLLPFVAGDAITMPLKDTWQKRGDSLLPAGRLVFRGKGSWTLVIPDFVFSSADVALKCRTADPQPAKPGDSLSLSIERIFEYYGGTQFPKPLRISQHGSPRDTTVDRIRGVWVSMQLICPEIMRGMPLRVNTSFNVGSVRDTLNGPYKTKGNDSLVQEFSCFVPFYGYYERERTSIKVYVHSDYGYCGYEELRFTPDMSKINTLTLERVKAKTYHNAQLYLRLDNKNADKTRIGYYQFFDVFALQEDTVELRVVFDSGADVLLWKGLLEEMPGILTAAGRKNEKVSFVSTVRKGYYRNYNYSSRRLTETLRYRY